MNALLALLFLVAPGLAAIFGVLFNPRAKLTIPVLRKRARP